MNPTQEYAGTLLDGAAYPLRALRLLQRYAQLRRYILIPILVNVVVGASLYVGLTFVALRWVNQLVQGDAAWVVLLGSLLQVVVVVLLFVVVGFLLVRFGVVLGSPWYGQLSEKLELLLSVGEQPVMRQGFGSAAYDLWRAVQFELKKLLLLLTFGLPLLLLNFVPLVGQVVVTGGGIALGATIACLDFFDAPLERRRLGFRQKLAVIRRHLPASAGFGLICFALVTIPVINLLAIPLCVAAGTLFFVEQIKPNLVHYTKRSKT